MFKLYKSVMDVPVLAHQFPDDLRRRWAHRQIKDLREDFSLHISWLAELNGMGKTIRLYRVEFHTVGTAINLNLRRMLGPRLVISDEVCDLLRREYGVARAEMLQDLTFTDKRGDEYLECEAVSGSTWNLDYYRPCAEIHSLADWKKWLKTTASCRLQYFRIRCRPSVWESIRTHLAAYGYQPKRLAVSIRL